MICVSCNFEHNENYCPNCGEKKDIKKITLPSILEDTFVSLTDMDKGFLFNLKALIIKPQKITADYIDGVRKGILNPVSFLILSVSFYIIIITVFRIPKELVEINEIPKSSYEKIGHVVGKFIRSNLKFFWILSIVPLALSLKLIFKKYNFIEHLAVSSFIIGQATLAGVISYLIFRFPLIFDPVVYMAILWLIYKVFKEHCNKNEAFILSFTTFILFIIQLILIISIIGIVKA